MHQATLRAFEYNMFSVEAGFVDLNDNIHFGLRDIGKHQGRILICPSAFLYDVINGNVPLKGRFAPLNDVTHILDLERGDLIQSANPWQNVKYYAELFNDGNPIPKAVFQKGIDPLADALITNPESKVVISCAQGVSRSPALATVLLFKLLTHQGEEANSTLLMNCLGVIGHSRPGAMPHIEVWKALQKHLSIVIDQHQLMPATAALARNNAGILSGRLRIPGINI